MKLEQVLYTKMVSAMSTLGEEEAVIRKDLTESIERVGLRETARQVVQYLLQEVEDAPRELIRQTIHSCHFITKTALQLSLTRSH